MSAPEPRSTLVAHLPYYRHAARALHAAGLLDRYLAPLGRARPVRVPVNRRLGRYAEQFNRTRVSPDLAGLPMRTLWAGQIGSMLAQRAFDPRAVGRALPARSVAWDLDAWWRVGASPVFHAVSGIARHSARRARSRGAFVVLDVRTAHPRARLAAVGPVLARHGITYRLPNESNLARLEAEFELADLIICNSEYTRRSFLEEGFAPDDVVAVDLGCDRGRFVPAPEPPRELTVLFVGRERLEKGFADVAGAVASVREARLLITGASDDAARRLLGAARHRSRFLGAVATTAMPDVYRQASVLVLPSLSDGFGLVVVEAMACGIPVIVSDHTGAADAITDGVEGFVVPAGDPGAIADRLRHLLDPAHVAEMGAKARASSERYGWDAYGERIVRVYRDVIAPRL